MNVGKIFEKNFKEAVKIAKEGQIFIYRIKDTDSSYHHTDTSKYTSKNICDFFMYYEGILYALELKSTAYNSFTFELDKNKPRKMIDAYQIDKLSEISCFCGVMPGFIFNFRNEEKGEEDTYFMRIEDFNTFVQNNTKKSINKSDIVVYGGIPVVSIKKRKYFTYDIDKMLDDIRTEFLEKECEGND